MTSKRLRRCECCSRQGLLKKRPSLMDLSDFMACDTCFDERAHPLSHIIKVEQRLKWRNIPPLIKNNVTVWSDESYVKVVDWAKRAVDQQVILYEGKAFPTSNPIKVKAPPPPPEIDHEEEELERIMVMTKKVVDECPLFFPDNRNKRPSIRGSFLAFLGIGHG